MNATVRTVLLNMFKNAVNAALTAAGPVMVWPKFFEFHDAAGLEHIATVLGSAIVARELMVYGPKILAWSANTNGGTTNGPQA